VGRLDSYCGAAVNLEPRPIDFTTENLLRVACDEIDQGEVFWISRILIQDRKTANPLSAQRKGVVH
jgi:hypothetical protein